MRATDDGEADGPIAPWLVENARRLDITCCRHGCFRRALWSPQEALGRLGGRVTLAGAARRLRCSACGARGRDGLVTCRPSIEDFYEQRWAAQGRAPH